VELLERLSTSNKGMSATIQTHSVIVLFTVQGLLPITDKAGKTDFSKEQTWFVISNLTANSICQSTFYKNMLLSFSVLLARRDRSDREL